MMTMPRTRVRYDRFVLRGWTYPFHELRDQGKMAALVPETDEVRWLKLFGREEPVEIRRGDVAIIYPQIGWPLPPGVSQAPATAADPTAALQKAAEKVEAFKTAAAAEAPPVSSVDDNPPMPPAEVVLPDMSPKLLSYHKDGETLREFVSRLTPELEREFYDVTQLQLYGSGEATLDSMSTSLESALPAWSGNSMTVSERHGEISALLAELQRLGAEVEAGPDAC